MDKSISIQEAAEILSVHRVTVYRLIRSGKLPAFRVGRIWRIREKDLEKITERKGVRKGDYKRR